MIKLPKTNLVVHPLCLGGNGFGWTADAEESQQVLDAYAGYGGNFIDTADMYSEWAPGHIGGESETIIGNWMKSRRNRAQMVIASKVCKLSTRAGLSRKNIVAACEDSLDRLQTDYIDLYYAHAEDPSTPIEETLHAFNDLIEAGKVRFIASSNFSVGAMQSALDTSFNHKQAAFVGVQNNYNLLFRSEYENGMRETVASNELAIMPYFGLARGFLSGKYRRGVSVESKRANGAAEYQNERGWKTLEVIDEIAARHKVSVAAVALAWLRAQPTVSTPIASARTVQQLAEIMQQVTLVPSEIGALSEVTG